MKQPKATKKPKTGRNAFPIFPLRASEEGQLEHWEAFAKRAKVTLSELIRTAVDEYTGRKK